MFAYVREPIDHWLGWMTEDQYCLQVRADSRDSKIAEKSIRKYKAFRGRAYALGMKADWDGDINEGPFIAGLPTNRTADDGHIMIGWKQSNNGTTYIVSPLKLPWLEDRENWGATERHAGE